MADNLISQVKIEEVTYDIKDTYARIQLSSLQQTVAGGVSFIISTNAATTPKSIVWKSGSSTITGTLEPSAAQNGAFYLVLSSKSVSGDADAYDEYVVVDDAGTKKWEKIGNTRVDFTGISLDKKTDVVLGEATTFTAPQQTVSFGTHTSDKVLGEATTFTNGTSDVSFGALTGHTASVLKDTTTINVTNPTITVSPTQKYLHPTSSDFVTSYAGASSKLALTTVPNVTGVGSQASWSATVTGEVLSFSFTPNNTPTLGTAITVASGSLTSSGSGASVMTGLGTKNTSKAITGMSAESSSSTGDITFTEGISSASATGGSASLVTTNNTAAAVISMPTATAAAQTITVGTNDKVTALIGLGTGTVPQHSITVGTNDKVTVLTSTTDIATS